MDEPESGQSMPAEEPAVHNDHPVACTICSTIMLPAKTATQIRKRVIDFKFKLDLLDAKSRARL